MRATLKNTSKFFFKLFSILGFILMSGGGKSYGATLTCKGNESIANKAISGTLVKLSGLYSSFRLQNGQFIGFEDLDPDINNLRFSSVPDSERRFLAKDHIYYQIAIDTVGDESLGKQDKREHRIIFDIEKLNSIFVSGASGTFPAIFMDRQANIHDPRLSMVCTVSNSGD